MVYIKKLEIYGFKSFGFKNTMVNFERGLVAVTGPNGSGKSNILDAIMFAIGENSPKALRVDRFQSLFHDSQNSNHRLIRVSLTFDNSDRGIPIDSDHVTLTREMEGHTGESQYYIDGKKVSKATLIELLEIVVAAPNKLNIVQQGMITRISELNSDERRKIIEDIVGLSYFDEKRTEALKQLEESDRRLEVALARMGEIRKRIDELEIERNDQLRYEQLESELKRFRAVRISNNIRSIRDKIQLQTSVLDSGIKKISDLSKQIEELNSQIGTLDSEKTKFIQEVDIANRAKAQIGSKITSLVYETERIRAMIKESQQKILQINNRLPQIDHDKNNILQRLNGIREQIEQKKRIIEGHNSNRDLLKSSLDEINVRLDRVTEKTTKYSHIKSKLDNRSKKLSGIKNNLEVSAARLEEKLKTNTDKLQTIASEIKTLVEEQDSNKVLLSDLKKQVESEKERQNLTIRIIDGLYNSKIRFEKEIDSSLNLISKAEGLAIKYEAKASVAKNAMSEDFAIAEFMKKPEEFKIKGLVHDLISWDKQYNRAIQAASSEWMKSFVVEDMYSMIRMAEYAKAKKLPRLKIIPLDMISRSKTIDIPEDDTDVIGCLSDFVYSSYSKLPLFLFGNVVLTKSSTSSYILARQGYTAVSVDGELFYPAGKSMSIDFGSKISDLTKAILFGDSIENLRKLLLSLHSLTQKKSEHLKDIVAKIKSIESDRTNSESKIKSAESQIFSLDTAILKMEKEIEQYTNEKYKLESIGQSLESELIKCKHRNNIVIHAIKRIADSLSRVDDSAIRNELTQINMEKNQLLKSLESVDYELRQVNSSIYVLNNELEVGSDRMKNMDEEKSRLNSEANQRKIQINGLEPKLTSAESELKILRDQEQNIIDSSGKSYSVLQEYEKKIKTLVESERRLSKEYHAIEKESALLRKEISDLGSSESRLLNDLAWLGYKELLDSFDVEAAIRELTDEFEAIKSRINLRAHESYVQVIDGYRNMSTRKNQLEMERNSIVLFIEEIVKEKEKVFMDSFKKVDDDIRKTFSEVTGGMAWLEIENPDDIFSSGILMMVQFPGKPGRESTALSGGEKTMAATVFLLALQSLKPSPFYLMDEVDAHLDAQNTERLSKILLERSKDGQIIMVTLKDSTVAKASLIYGVYPKQGISQIIRYKHPQQVSVAEVIKSDGK